MLHIGKALIDIFLMYYLVTQAISELHVIQLIFYGCPLKFDIVLFIIELFITERCVLEFVFCIHHDRLLDSKQKPLIET